MRNTYHKTTHIFVLLVTLIWAESLLPNRAQAAVKTAPTAPATPASKTDLGSINESLEDKAVEIEATVKSILPPREGSKAPVRINLSDATGSMTLVVWADIFDVIKSQSPIDVGSTVHATARVSKYKDNLQLKIKSATDIKSVTKPVATESHTEAPSPAAPAEPASAAGDLAPVANITTAMMNHDVTVKGIHHRNS
jgi:DNA/RNA endonuclease YhcR with UshA esterase domain